MSHQLTLPGLPSTTSLPASADGPTRSDSPAGPMTGPCGPDPALASLSARQAKEQGLMTSATYGLIGDGSSTSADLQSSLASRLRLRTAAIGSPEYALTWKHWDMPRGPQICALRASARRTSGNDFGGWPTPKDQNPAQDTTYAGGNPTLARVAGWATPTARDYRSESATDEYNEKRWSHPRGKPLSAQAGQAQSGSNAPTEKRGALNPALSRWLMGYPAEWDSCGATAMQSARRLRRFSSRK